MKIKRQKLHNKIQSTSEGGTTKMKRPQYCTICKNHNQQVLKKRHKCPYSDCQCPLCQLSRRVQCIMCHQQRLWRFRKSMEKNGSPQGNKEPLPPSSSSLTPSSSSSISSSSSSSSSSFACEGEYLLQESVVDEPQPLTDISKDKEAMKADVSGKQQVCDKCRNHNVWVLKRGHKGHCPYEDCSCKYCSFTIKRRDLMKHQQRVRRAQVTSLPTKDSQDFVLRPAESSGHQQANNVSSLVNESSSSSPATSPVHYQEAQNNLTDLSNERQAVWPSCPNETVEEPRMSPSTPQEQHRECATFPPPVSVNHTPAYTIMPPEPPMHMSLDPMKMKSRAENCVAYSTTIQSRDFIPPAQEFTSLRSYADDTDMNLHRQQAQLRYGVDPEDLQLRQWPVKDIETDTSFSNNGSNFRGSSLCIPSSQTQHITLPQSQMQSQPLHHPVVAASSTNFEPHSVSLVGWRAPVSVPSNSSSTAHAGEIAHSQITSLPSATCGAYVPAPPAQSQAAWWQQTRLASLERTNNG